MDRVPPQSAPTAPAGPAVCTSAGMPALRTGTRMSCLLHSPRCWPGSMEEHGRGKLVACYGMAVLVCSESSAAGEQAPYHRRNRSRVGRLGRVEGVGGVRKAPAGSEQSWRSPWTMSARQSRWWSSPLHNSRHAHALRSAADPPPYRTRILGS